MKARRAVACGHSCDLPNGFMRFRVSVFFHPATPVASAGKRYASARPSFFKISFPSPVGARFCRLM